MGVLHVNPFIVILRKQSSPNINSSVIISMLPIRIAIGGVSTVPYISDVSHIYGRFSIIQHILKMNVPLRPPVIRDFPASHVVFDNTGGYIILSIILNHHPNYIPMISPWYPNQLQEHLGKDLLVGSNSSEANMNIYNYNQLYIYIYAM